MGNTYPARASDGEHFSLGIYVRGHVYPRETHITVTPYQFEPAGASSSHASDSDGDDGDPGSGRLESTNWYVYNGKDHPAQLFLCINHACTRLYIIIIIQLHVL